MTSSMTTTSRAAAVVAWVCQRAGQAARTLLGDGMRVRVADTDPANIECLIERRGIEVDTVAQASAQSWTKFGGTYVTVTVARRSPGVRRASW